MKTSKEQFNRIKAFIEEHKEEKAWYQEYIAEEFGCSRSLICKINKCDTYEDFVNRKPEKYEELVKRLCK